MVKIRLRRMGATKRPTYRVVVADARSPQGGRFIETIGHYNPLTEPTTIVFKQDRLSYWISVGAQPTEIITKLMTRAGIADKRGKLIPMGQEPSANAATTEAQPAPATAAPVLEAAPPAQAAPVEVSSPVQEVAPVQEAAPEAVPAEEVVIAPIEAAQPEELAADEAATDEMQA